MSTCIALWRGINVGTAKRVAMADLRTVLASLGYGEPRTLLNSGNAVFDVPGRRGASAVEADVRAAVREQLGVDSVVQVRTAAELGSVVDANPFLASGIEPGLLAASFLRSAPTPAALGLLDRKAYAPDDVAVGNRVLYLLRPNGVMGSRLPPFDVLLSVDVTERTWATVTKLHRLATS